ncbi:amidohydrolase family protein [Rheinheimera sp.]|uniref:amidohydrolase family protein n=1 Tax=Rheinheimera sp. TaxID=1869214 RepID=UPI00307DD5B9
MTRLRLSLCSTALLCALVPAAHADQTTPVQGIRDKSLHWYALTNATVLTEPGKRLDNATLLIQDGKIIRVGGDVAVPAGYQQIDASGYYIYPGFIDLFSQYGVPKAGKGEGFSFGRKPNYSNERQGGNASNAAIHARLNWVDQFKPDAEQARSYQQQGFTTVQSARQDGIFRGQAFVASLLPGLPNEAVIKSTGNQFMAFSKGSSQQSYPSSLMGSIALIRQTLSDASWYAQAHGKTDWRFYNQPVEFNADLAALGQLSQQGVVFEVGDDQALLRADLLLKEFGISKASLVGTGYEYNRLAELKASGRSLILPLAFPAAPTVQQLTDQLDVELAQLRHWERAPANAAALAKAEIPFALTLHKLEKPEQFWPNLRKAVQYGLSEQQALAALTTVPAKWLGLEAQLGKVAPGYLADLVVSKGDLFADGEIVATWVRGQQQQFKAMDLPQFAGTYTLSAAGLSVPVQLTDKDGKVEGKVSVAGKESKLSHVLNQRNQLQFSLDLKALEQGPGVVQFSGVLDGNVLTGTLVMADGQRYPVSSARQPAAKPEDKKAAKPDVTLLSSLTTPNRAYGVMTKAKQQNVHIKNATVWTSAAAGKLENTDLLVEDGRFVKIGQNLKTPSGFTVIDATGLHVTAGIIDEHSHIAIDQGVNEGSDAITSEVRIGDVLDADDINIYRGLAGGTTTAQLLHGSANPIGGQAQIIQLRWGDSAQQLKFKGAPPSIKFALGENVKQANWGEAFTIRYPQTRIGVDTIIRDAFQAAKEYKAQLAAYEDLSRSEKAKTAAPRPDYRLNALVEILDKQRFIHVHSYVASEILMIIKLADEMGFNITTFTHILEGYKVADEMKKHGASASSFADWWAYKMEVQDAIPYNVCLMQQQGVLTSINSDSPDLQRRLNQEAAKAVVYCGMDEQAALNMATINPAKQLKIDHKVGSIEEGKQADFVIWTANPLSVYAQAKSTWIEGAMYYSQQQDELMQQQVAAEKQQLIQKVLNAPDKDKAGSGASYKANNPVWHCEDNHDLMTVGGYQLIGHSH